MVGEVSEQRNFSKSPLRELYLLKDTGDEFYGHCLARDFIDRRTMRVTRLGTLIMDEDHEQHAHDNTIRPRTQLSDQLPSSFQMENLLKRRDNRVIASASGT